MQVPISAHSYHVQHGVMPPLLVYCSSGFTFSWKHSLLSPSIGQTKPSPLLCVIQASQGPFPSSDLEPRISHGFFYCFGPKQLSFVTHPLRIQDPLFSPKPYCSLWGHFIRFWLKKDSHPGPLIFCQPQEKCYIPFLSSGFLLVATRKQKENKTS